MPGEVLAVLLHKEKKKRGEKSGKEQKNKTEENANCSAALAPWITSGKRQ